nr:hypothetical protein [uncultured Butyrivibrio sp.]
MKTWLEAVIEEISFSNTEHGQYKNPDLDGAYTALGNPYGGDGPALS